MFSSMMPTPQIILLEAHFFPFRENQFKFYGQQFRTVVFNPGKYVLLLFLVHLHESLLDFCLFFEDAAKITRNGFGCLQMFPPSSKAGVPDPSYRRETSSDAHLR